MQEFICPNGRMSINGVCPIFEGGDGQVRDYQIPKKTFDQKYDDIEDIEKEREKSGFFKFDFEKETPSAKKSASNIINNNLKAYDSFVENKLGIPANVQNVFRIGATIATGSLMPFAIPFLGGMALNNSENNRIQNITNQDPQGTINTVVSPKIMNIQPTNQDIYRGGGGGGGSRRGDADISDSQRGGFATDDTAGFF
jgi:hypothetical protein